MSPAREPFAASIESLGLRKITDPYFLKNENLFYKYKDGTILPYYKEDIWKVVDIYKPCTFFPILQELDIPFIEERWLDLIKSCVVRNERNLTAQVLGKYISWCKLRDIEQNTFKNSNRFFIDWLTGSDYNNFHYNLKIKFEISYDEE